MCSTGDREDGSLKAMISTISRSKPAYHLGRFESRSNWREMGHYHGRLSSGRSRYGMISWSNSASEPLNLIAATRPWSNLRLSKQDLQTSRRRWSDPIRAQGDVKIDFTGRAQRGLRAVTLRSFLKNKFDSVFKPQLLEKPLRPTRSTPGRRPSMTITEVLVDDGWIQATLM